MTVYVQKNSELYKSKENPALHLTISTILDVKFSLALKRFISDYFAF